MATWRDGPEYAPAARPSDFEGVDAPGLEPGEPRLDVAAGAPGQPPSSWSADAERPPLSAFVPLPANRRDPKAAFDVAGAAITAAGSTWGADHTAMTTSHPTVPDPRQPFQVSSAMASRTALASGEDAPAFPPPVSAPSPQAGWFPPPSQAVATQPRYPAPGQPGWFDPVGAPPPGTPWQLPLSLGGWWSALGPGVVIALILGGLLAVVAPVMLVVALIASGRVKIRRRWVQGTLTAVASVTFFVGVISLVFSIDDLGGWWSALGATSLVGCWASLAVSSAMVVIGLRNGEPVQA